MPRPRLIFAKVAKTVASLLTISLGGCSYPPSIGLLGAYFPDWLFCWTAAVVVVMAGHQLLKAFGATGWILYTPLTYPLIAGAVASLVWLSFFNP